MYMLFDTVNYTSIRMSGPCSLDNWSQRDATHSPGVRSISLLCIVCTPGEGAHHGNTVTLTSMHILWGGGGGGGGGGMRETQRWTSVVAMATKAGTQARVTRMQRGSTQGMTSCAIHNI